MSVERCERCGQIYIWNDEPGAPPKQCPHCSSEPLDPEPPAEASAAKRSVLEMLLDPEAIQGILSLGGALMVLGLILWLSGLPFFQRSDVLSVVFAAAGTALLALGITVVKKTRFGFAGEAIAFLACVLLPLDLWFMHTQNLVRVDQGLWSGGLVCCLLYLATAYLLRNPRFVYVVQGGVIMTALLILADRGQATDLLSLSVCFVVVGLISLHLERFFPQQAAVFSRDKFGVPLFWSAQVQLAIGLLLLLGGEMIRWSAGIVDPAVVAKQVADFMLENFWIRITLPTLPHYSGLDLSDRDVRLFAAGLWLVGAYAYVYSDLAVRRLGYYIYLAACCLVAAELTIIDWRHSSETLLAVLSLSAFAVHFGRRYVRDPRVDRAISVMSIALGVLPVLLGIVLHLRAASHPEASSANFALAAALALTTAGAVGSAWIAGSDRSRIAAGHLAMAGLSLVMMTSAALRAVGVSDSLDQAPVLMLIASIAAVCDFPAIRRRVGHGLHVAGAVAINAIFVQLIVAESSLAPLYTPDQHWPTTIFWWECSALLAWIAIRAQRPIVVNFAVLTAYFGFWKQLGGAVDSIGVSLALTIVSLVCLGVLRGLHRREETAKTLQTAVVGVQFALWIAVAAGMLVSLLRLGRGPIVVQDQLLELVLLLGASVIACFVAAKEARMPFAALTIGLLGSTALSIQVVVDLTAWQVIEIVTVLLGLLMFSFGLFNCLDERRKGFTIDPAPMWTGSFLMIAPLAIAVIVHRFRFGSVSLGDEFGLLITAVLLLVIGATIRFRAPTLIGGLGLAVQLLVLVVFVGIQAQAPLAVGLSIGGGLLFAGGIALIVFRQQLLELPKRIERRDGWFAILGWQ